MRPPGTVWVAAALLSAAATVAAPLSHQASALGDAPSPAASGQAAQAGGGDVIVHLFQWPWESVAQECTDFLGPNGYDAVQVSPPQEHVVLEEEGHPWWQDYQPVSYRLESRRGDRDDFASMVGTCAEAGVDIYVDAVLNHMTGTGSAGSGVGSAGSGFEKYHYPGIYQDADFGECRETIENWDDPGEVRNCELLDLADLATGQEYVRATLTGYLNDLTDLGVAGFRVDAAKHMPPEDVAAVMSGVQGDVHVFQEVIEDEAISPAEYTHIGDVTDFAYSRRLSGAVSAGDLSGLAGLGGSDALRGDQATVFVDNHDTQRENPVLTYKDGAAYDVASAFMLAHPYGSPKVMSSFDFGAGDFDAGPPAEQDGTTAAVECDDEAWVCEHRDQAIAGMVGFRSATHGAGITDWWDNGGGQAAFGRGGSGFAVFNREDAELAGTFRTSLPAGTYCDVTAGGCEETYEVGGDGTFTATVPTDGVLALHVEATP